MCIDRQGVGLVQNQYPDTTCPTHPAAGRPRSSTLGTGLDRELKASIAIQLQVM